jgi:hypothetical protein
MDPVMYRTSSGDQRSSDLTIQAQCRTAEAPPKFVSAADIHWQRLTDTGDEPAEHAQGPDRRASRARSIAT